MRPGGPLWVWARIAGALLLAAGIIHLILGPLIGEKFFDTVKRLEHLEYIGLLLVIAGLAVLALPNLVPRPMFGMANRKGPQVDVAQSWAEMTQQHFDLFNHDLGRPLRGILGKERKLRAMMRARGIDLPPPLKELLDEVEAQAPTFRLMLANIQALVQIEGPAVSPELEGIEPTEVVRKIVDRYTSVVHEGQKKITWWAEPAELGIVLPSSSAVEHIVANLVDNAMRFATSHVEVRLSRNPTHFFIRVWDDGPGIASQYLPHIFDRGWTPEVARREEKSSSGLGLFIARSMARRYDGEITVESVAKPEPGHHTSFLLSMPLGRSDSTPA